MTLRQMKSKFSWMLGNLICFAFSQGFEITLGEGTIKVVNCKHCRKKVSIHKKGSLHHIGLAQDIDLFKDGRYLRKTEAHRVLGAYWEQMGGSWGGRFADGNHYSLQYGKRQ